MPDANKFSRLREIGYVITGTCGTCKHGQFSGRNRDGASGWGTCAKFKYTHLKHSGDDRGVSIVSSGTCPGFERDEGKITTLGLGAHEEFVKP